jgi:hypothetical protein
MSLVHRQNYIFDVLTDVKWYWVFHPGQSTIHHLFRLENECRGEFVLGAISEGASGMYCQCGYVYPLNGKGIPPLQNFEIVNTLAGLWFCPECMDVILRKPLAFGLPETFKPLEQTIKAVYE